MHLSTNEWQVAIAPLGDGADDEKQAIALLTSYDTEQTITSGAFPVVVRMYVEHLNPCCTVLTSILSHLYIHHHTAIGS